MWCIKTPLETLLVRRNGKPFLTHNSMKIFFCSYILHKPTFVITEKAFKHAWIMTLATERFKNVDDLMRWYKHTYPVEVKEWYG